MKRKTDQINLEYPMYRGINEIIEITGFSQYEIRKLLKQGKLPHHRSGNKVLVNLPAFLKMLNRECGLDE